MRLVEWLEEAQTDGQDTFGAYEWALGIALLVGMSLFALLPAGWLAALFLWALILAALWYGREVELHQLVRMGRRRYRDSLSMGLPWLALAWSLIWTLLALAFAHARGFHRLPGWADGPLAALLLLSLLHLGLGAQLNVGRWVYLGLALCALAVLVPALPPLRAHMHLAVGLLGGAALLLSGYVGRRSYARERRIGP
ncbi:MAG: hypothetical protein JXA74_17570 [Anaerolineae bacterium]|nr:hypothetical protein [Anaerolineae bacterium]